MKIRNGYVSNSSSSSFIIGYGVIDTKKYDELIKFINTHCIDNESYLIGMKKDLNLKYIDVDLDDSITDTDLLLIVSEWNDEGDDYFFDSSNYELDFDDAYDISFYSEKQQELIEALSNGVYFDKSKSYDCRYGAMRT